MNAKALRAAVEALGGPLEATFQRHQSLRQPPLAGSTRGGRWGQPRAFPVLYLGRPRESVIAEAYRHLVDPVEGMRPELVPPRLLLSVGVRLERVADLRKAAALDAVGLDAGSLAGPYEPCQRVAAAAHGAGVQAILAPSASGLGETLAVFTDRRVGVELLDEEIWAQLPPDPRR
ncbi:MAG: RES domain-containing protein [Solirubrobacterales bacterium]|nr:RES domain-containing protein [Solirubrobacterales bacterium]